MTRYFIIIFMCCATGILFAQKNSIKGYVYEDEYRTPMPGVTVYSVSGNKSFTDSSGYYTIRVQPRDSVYFSYKTRVTHKYPVDTITDPDNFEIAIHLNILARKKPPPGYLPDVIVYSNTYLGDSISNRKEYADIFNFKKPGLADIAQVPKIGNIPIPLGVYMDFDAIAQSFQFRKNKRKENYRDFAVWLEQEKYIDYRYNKRLVSSITMLSAHELDTFMHTYRPKFLDLITMNDVELNVYIKKCLKDMHESKTPRNFFEKLHNGGITSVKSE